MGIWLPSHAARHWLSVVTNWTEELKNKN